MSAGGVPARTAALAALSTLATSALAMPDEVGYRPDERICIVTVGGCGVGASSSSGARRVSRRRIGTCRSAHDGRGGATPRPGIGRDAGEPMSYDETTPDRPATAIADGIGEPVMTAPS